MEYNFDELSVQKIVAWAQNTQFPQSVQLTNYEDIYNVNRYIVANVYDIQQHYPDPLYNAAITRLYRLKEYLETHPL